MWERQSRQCWATEGRALESESGSGPREKVRDPGAISPACGPSSLVCTLQGSLSGPHPPGYPLPTATAVGWADTVQLPQPLQHTGEKPALSLAPPHPLPPLVSLVNPEGTLFRRNAGTNSGRAQAEAPGYVRAPIFLGPQEGTAGVPLANVPMSLPPRVSPEVS